MISGTVNSDHQPIISLTFCAPDGREHQTDAMVDTGFNGWVTVPPDLVALLGFPWLERSRTVLADGSETLSDVYSATVVWDGIELTVPADTAEGLPLVGMLLLNGYEVNIQAVVGGRLEIRTP